MEKWETGGKYLITTDNWFIAPDGDQYRAVFGTVHGISKDEETLGIKTNRSSTNWYLQIGNMVVAGCQIHYCIKTETVNIHPVMREIEHEGNLKIVRNSATRIYCADEQRESHVLYGTGTEAPKGILNFLKENKPKNKESHEQ